MDDLPDSCLFWQLVWREWRAEVLLYYVPLFARSLFR